MSDGNSKPYVIGFEKEHERLERQARIANIEGHLRFVPVQPGDRVLDAGCGSGSMTRLLAASVSGGEVTGIDTSEEHLAYARARAADEGIGNIDFQTGDIFSLPFDDDTFDLVWCKYVLQWVNDPASAIEEFRRVTRPGGVIVCAHFDGFCVTHDPVDDKLQRYADTFFNAVVDPYIGRKCYSMFHQAGLIDVKVDHEADASFHVVGAIDADRRRNYEEQLDAAFPAAIEILGSKEHAQEFRELFFAHQDRNDTFSTCSLYFVRGAVP